MFERWFSDEELRELSRPTMDRAIEAMDAGDLVTARALCEGMKYEWLMLHDLYAHGMAGLLSFIKERLGEDAVAEAQQDDHGYWERQVEKIGQLDRRAVVELLAATWRAHSTSGVGTQPGCVHDHRGRAEGDLRDESVRVRSAAVAQWLLRG